MMKKLFFGQDGVLLPNAIYVPKGEEIAISKDWLIFPEAISGEGKVWTIDGRLEPCIKQDNEVWVDSNVENPFAEPITYKGKNKYGWLVGEITEDVTNELDFIDRKSVQNIILSNYATEIPDQAFFECYDLQYIIISNSVYRIGKLAFKDCENIKIHYNGNSSDFKNTEFGINWNDNVPSEYAYCDDAEVRIKYNCIAFTALSQDCSIGFYNNHNSSIYSTIEYSFDQVNWNILTDNVAVENGCKMYCRGLNPNGISGGYGEEGYNYFTGEGKFNVSGDIMSIIDYETMPETMVGTFYNLFGGNIDTSRDNFVDIVDASGLILSAKILTDDCYQRMFSACTSMTHGPQIKAEVLAPYCCWGMFIECTSLTTAPELPATMLAKSCYSYMFSYCTSLTAAPELPATVLVDSCYESMFKNCTSLTTAPELPATELVEACYSGMFNSCTSLTTAPELPATALAYNCYYFMFKNCTYLTTAPELPATELVEYCYEYMFYGCTSLTTAPELPATELAEYCYNSMFTGCTSLTAAPELPAMKLASYCYQSMFENCTSLITAPELPATTLAEGCYLAMFRDCTSLNYIKCLATDISAIDCTNSWVDRVSSTGTFIKHPDMNDWTTGKNGIPIGWIVKDYIEYDMVDLGLPSGTLWADRNVGAASPEDNGLYFDWGNVDGHAVDENGNVTDGYSFDKNTYATTSGGQYTGSELDAEHDAATVNMGEEWRMPAVEETLELVQNTDHYYIGESGNIVAGPFDYTDNYSDKGLDGSKLRSICFVKKGEGFNYNDRSNFIEFPFAGICIGSVLDNEGLYGNVWSSSVYEGYVQYARSLRFDSDGYLDGGSYGSRYGGISVRGVKNN